MIEWFSRALLIGALAGAAAAQSPAVEDDNALARGAQILLPFKQQLLIALQAGLAEGPTAAVSVCRVEAPRIAGQFSVDGVEVGRSSHRLRNPENAAPQWVVPLMQRYLDEPEFRQPSVVALGDGRVGYVEPLVIQPLCLACHGSQIAEPLASEIARLYPEDAATGFALNEFRGVAWAAFPDSSNSSAPR